MSSPRLDQRRARPFAVRYALHVLTVTQVESSSLKVYYDGALQSTNVPVGTISAIRVLFNKIELTNGGDNDFCQVRCWNRVLSDAELAAQWRALKAKWGTP